MLSDQFNKLMELVSSGGRKTKWGRVAGSIVIANIMGVWSYLCITTQQFIPIDVNMTILMAAIFFFLGVQSIFTKPEPPPPPPQNPEDDDIVY